MEKVTESTIAGQFRGWKGRGAYKLRNGEIWKQVQYKHKYIYNIVTSPKAVIWRDGAKYFLEVEGMDDKVEVKKGSSFDLDDDY